MISREEIKEENRQTMICYLMTFNYSERKLKEKSYQELSAIYLNHNPPKALLNQPITLDKDIEEAIKTLYDWALEGVDLYSSCEPVRSVKKAKSTIKQHIQAQQSKLDKIEEVIKSMNFGVTKLDTIKQILGDE